MSVAPHRFGLIGITLIGVLTVATAGAAQPATGPAPQLQLSEARNAFRAGNCPQVILLLGQALYPTPRLAERDDLVEAHVLYGACALAAGDRVAARREFESALFLGQELDMDTLLFPAETVAFFREVRRGVQDQTHRDEQARALAEEREALRRYRASLVVYEMHPYYVNFIPFGAGQFQNGQRGKGLSFAIAQATLGGASAGIWLYLVGEYGFGGQVPPASAGTVRRLQQIEIATGAACLGLMAWGVVDSLLHYQPRKKVDADDSLLPRRAAQLNTRLRLWLAESPGQAAPTLGLRLGLHGEF